MLRGVEHKRQGSSGGPLRQDDCGLGTVIPTPLTPRLTHRAGSGSARLLGAMFLLGVLISGAMAYMRADQAATADCTALVLDRDTGRTEAVPCAGTGPSLPNTLTALLRTGLPDEVAATR
jgi:hypothetical protein